MRLPLGYSSLKPTLGRTLAARREDAFLKQEVLAGDVGISRVALSMIETGRAWPRSQTLDRLLAALDLDWDAVARKGRSKRAPRPFDGSARGESAKALGESLRMGREAAELGLRDLADECGLSIAQLSRIERGEASRSKAFGERPGSEGLARHDRVLYFTNPVLARYAAAGRSME